MKWSCPLDGGLSIEIINKTVLFIISKCLSSRLSNMGLNLGLYYSIENIQ